MMKKITLLFAALLCSMSLIAREYTGTMSVEGSTMNESREGVGATITQTGTNVYSITFDAFTMEMMGMEMELDEMTFDDLKGATGKDGFTTVSGTKHMTLSDLLGGSGFSFGDIFGGLGDLFGGLGNLFGGLDLGSLLGGFDIPIMINSRFNDNQMTANIIVSIALGFGGQSVDNETVNIHYDGTSGDAPEPALYLVGSFNEWNEENKVPLTLENGKWVVTQAMDANAEFKFKDEAGNWIGGVSDGNFIVTKEQVEEGTPLSMAIEGGMNFQIPVAGEWTLTVDKENMQVVISGAWNEIVEIADVYILGEVNTNSWSPNVGMLMDTEDGVIYTAEITADGRNDGFNYFSFTTRLAENVGDWDAIEPYRFGAVSEGDFWVTPDLIGQEITLTTENGQALKIAAGKYNLTVNLENYTLVIEGEGNGVRGDLNGDGQVDVTDVDIMIDLVLGKDNSALVPGAVADLSGDGQVDVTDVDQIIDIVLGK